MSTAPAAPIGPAPAPPTAPPPAPPPVVVAAPGEPRPETGRPTELAFGIGVGYALPTSLETPNTTSVRVRLPSGLTFEPQLVFATTSDNMGTTNTHQNEFTLGSLVRYPLRVHRKVDLELIGNVALSSHTTDPDGDNNNTTTTTINLGYGGALSYWFSPHWNLSLTATNPLLSYNRNNQETGVNTTVTDKTTTLGVIWDPQVTVMIHLYD
ncbi:MAG TPA: hypothetical protein VH165_19760 [Kofleriaceae bacterium]|nr:hypothetical protein [Kofleriaceae bacterium]